MNATYTHAKIAEYLAAHDALNAVPQGQDYTAERDRLTAAEDALLADGWKNEETEDQLRAMLAD